MDVYENTKKFYDKYNIIICILCLLFFVIERTIRFILGMLDDSDNEIIVADIYANFVFIYPITVFVLSIVGYVKQKKRNIKNKLAVINIVLSSICLAFLISMIVELIVLMSFILYLCRAILEFFNPL